MLVDQVNRILLGLLGLILAAAGAAILATGLGALGPAAANRPVLTNYGRSLLTRNDLWPWIVLTAAGVALVLLGLYWLRTQFKTDRLGRVDLEPDRGHGHLRLSGAALTSVITDEAEAATGVEGATARLVTRRGGTQLHLTARLNPHMDLHDPRRHLETQVIDHARQALAPDPLPTRLRLEIARRGERVR